MLVNAPAPHFQNSAPIPPLHPPGRSKTRAAWGALLVLFLFFLLFFFHSFLLRMSVRSALWVLQPVTGLTIKAQKMEVAWGKPIHWHQMTVSTGQVPFSTQMTFQDCSIEFSSWWRICFGDHVLINSFRVSQGKGVIDRRHLSSDALPFWKKPISSFSAWLEQKCNFLPASVQLSDVSFLLLTEGERYTVDRLSCNLPNKITSQLTYDSIVIEAGTIHCHLAAGKAKALWNGKKLSLRQLRLAEEMTLQDLTLVPHRDRVELGLVAEIFDGLLRADGSLRQTSEGTFLDSAALGQQLPLGRLSRFLGLKKNISGIIREGRLTFRGFMLHPLDADASLRLVADNVHAEKREGASLSFTANLIGHKMSLLDFQLRQQENHATASGEITLPEEWHKIAQAPFLLKLKANIADAAKLANLIGISWDNTMTGKFFADGEVHGGANRAEGYLNVQGTAMTAYDLPLDSLKLQLLFQGEKTNLTNLDLWSGSDHFEGSGIIENKWPHRYEGRATLQSNNLSEKFIPLLQQHDADVPPFWDKVFPRSLFEKSNLKGGTLKASWEGSGEATRNQGSFNIILNNLFKDFHKVYGHGEGSYGLGWISFSSLDWEEGIKKYKSQMTLSSCGIDLSKISITEDQLTTLSGNAFLPLDATRLLQQPFSLSHTLLPDVPLAIHLKSQHLAIKPDHFSEKLLPAFFDGTLDASGLLEKPSIHVTLIGKNGEEQKGNLNMKFNLVSEQGAGTIDFMLASEKNKLLTFQGKLPVGLMIQKEHTPLQGEEHWKLGPALAPLDLNLSIFSLNLDTLAAHYLPAFFHVEKSQLSGNLTCKGTLGEMEPSGELQFQVGSVAMNNHVTPLHQLQGRLVVSKEKMDLHDASAWLEKEKITISGSTEWHHQKHDYHFSGTHLPIYQSAPMNIKGDLNLSLQGENQIGILRGNLTVKEIEGAPKLWVTPFLIPPGIELASPMISPSTGLPPWTIDVAVVAAPGIASLTTQHSPFETINLHLSGDCLSPTIDGSISLQHLPIIFPNATLSLLDGSCNFDANRPWKPVYNLTASGVLNDKKVVATLSKDHTLQLQSDPVALPSTLALQLSHKNQETWLTELPYWVREQAIMEPTTLIEPVSRSNSFESRTDLGFTGCGIFYEAEMK